METISFQDQGKLRSGILLDVGCRDRKEPHFTGISDRKFEGVDIVHNLETFPYPLKDEFCLTIKAAHVIEHIKPWLFFGWFNEMWRLLVPNGQLAVSAPFANSQGFFNDPSHCTYITEATFQHLDPNYPMYKQHEPRPWKIEYASWKYGGNIEAILSKRDIKQIQTVSLVQKAIMLGAIQNPVELSPFLDMIAGLDLKTVVEIGTARGGVFYALCQLATPSAKVISIDMEGGEFGGGYSKEDAQRFKGFGKPKQRLSFIRTDSHKETTKNALKKILGTDLIDLLFIDGDHTYEGVKADWEMYSPLVRDGGLVAFHDIQHHIYVPACKVDKLWNELKKTHETWEYTDPGDNTWGGIGVLRKKIREQPVVSKVERRTK